MKEQLEKILGTIVSQDILDLITDKQRWLLKAMIENLTTPNKGAFYYNDEAESRKVIYSILDYGKGKLKPREHSEKVKDYLQTKGII